MRKRRLSPLEVYPAGEKRVRAEMIELASGTRVRVLQAGPQDAHPLVLVAGWGCTAWLFHETILPLAAAGHRVVAVELHGHGFSDKPASESRYSTASMRDHLLEIVDALGLERAGFVGHSMGAAIVAQLAALAPHRVTGVVLVAPVGFAGVRGMAGFRALTPELTIPLLPWLVHRFIVRMILELVSGTLRPPTERDVDEFWAPTQFRGYTRALRHLLHAFSWDSALPSLTVPWMTIMGSKDVLSPASDAPRFIAHGAVAAPLIVPNAGHVLFTEAPEIVNDALTDFFRPWTGAKLYLTDDE